jgi:hypothetical protein
VAVDVSGIVQILRTLATQINRPTAPGDDRLTEIVVEILFGIGVLGIELTYPLMGH